MVVRIFVEKSFLKAGEYSQIHFVIGDLLISRIYPSASSPPEMISIQKYLAQKAAAIFLRNVVSRSVCLISLIEPQVAMFAVGRRESVLFFPKIDSVLIPWVSR